MECSFDKHTFVKDLYYNLIFGSFYHAVTIYTLAINYFQRFTDGPDIWIEGPVRVVCGSTAHFQATVKEKKVSCLSVTWQKISKDDIKQIDTSNKTFWGKTNKELSIESVCKEDEGKYQAVLSIEEDRIKTSIQSNVIFMHVVGGMILFNIYFKIKNELLRNISHELTKLLSK